MKLTVVIAIVSCAVLVSSNLHAEAVQPLSARTPVIMFEGTIVDADGLRYDGKINAQVWFYKTAACSPVDLLYAEEFADAVSSRGQVRLPLTTGSPLEGSVFALDDFASQPEVYTDIIVNGATMLHACPVTAQLSALRAERARYADGLRQPLTLTPADIPSHPASRITTGILDDARIPPIPYSVIVDEPATPAVDTFAVDRIPLLSAKKVTAGVFGADSFANGIQAEWFTSDTLDDDVIPSEIMRSTGFGMRSGSAADGTAVGIPSGFTRSQCAWFVSVGVFEESETGGSGIDHMQVLTDGNGVVTCKYDTDTAGNLLNKKCTANYLTICKK